MRDTGDRVVGGEIPWVINTTGGGLVYPEGDTAGLTRAITQLHADVQLRRDLAEHGLGGRLALLRAPCRGARA